MFIPLRGWSSQGVGICEALAEPVSQEVVLCGGLIHLGTSEPSILWWSNPPQTPNLGVHSWDNKEEFVQNGGAAITKQRLIEASLLKGIASHILALLLELSVPQMENPRQRHRFKTKYSNARRGIMLQPEVASQP